MVVKFRMPKVQLNFIKNSMFKELLMTFIATTLSIVLTFGTAHFIDEKHKKDLGRQTAMMVIHDMDNTIELLQSMAKEEEQANEMARYIIDNYEMMDSIDEDTIWTLSDYLTYDTNEDRIYKFDESTEKVFLSSQESWKNIDNAVFIDAVQDFYSSRHDYFDVINKSPYWRKPISSEAYYQYLMERSDQRYNAPEMLKQYLANKEVMYYLDNSSFRQGSFSNAAENLQHYSNLCKFTIGISDEELEEYVRNRESKGRNIKEKELIGKWVSWNTESTYSSYEFLEDHTYKHTYINRYPYPLYIGRLDVSCVALGTWKLKGDSIYMTKKPNIRYKIEQSNIKPKPGKEKEVEDYINELKEMSKEREKEAKKEKDVSATYGATINPSGNKIEFVQVEENEYGKKETQTHYFSRAKDEEKEKEDGDKPSINN
jgi:hypothetical protein